MTTRRMPMTTKKAIKHFGSVSKLARALNVAPQAVSQWGKYPPQLRQIQIQTITGGALRAQKSFTWEVLAPEATR